MRSFTALITMLVAVILVCLIWPRPAHAYLDPGTGSYIIQLIMAGLLGAAFAVKLFWRDIRTFFKDLFAKDEGHEEAED